MVGVCALSKGCRDAMRVCRNKFEIGAAVAGLVLIFCGVAAASLARQQPPSPAASQPAQSGQTPSEPTQKGENEAAQSSQRIAVEVKVVNVLASVRDKKGKTIGDLSKDDFVLTEDGKPQAIT